MRFRELRITNFGKLTGKRLLLKEGINLIYGKNESGKSTLHAFLKGILYGMERGRGRAALKDGYSRYEPWENAFSYGGIVRFESGGKMFFLERSFGKDRKQSRLICEEDGEELSLEAGDLEMLLGGMDRAGFENTVSIEQLKARPDQSLSEALQDYAANYFSGGTQELQLKKALDYLKEQRKQAEKRQKAFEEKRRHEKEMLRREEGYFQRDIEKLRQEEEAIERKEEEERDINISKRRGRADRKANGRADGRADGKADGRAGTGILPGICGMVLLVVFWLAAYFFLKGSVRILTEGILLGIFGLLGWKTVSRFFEKGRMNPELRQTSREQDGWKRQRIREERREKEICCANLREQMEELDVVTDAWLKLEEEKKELLLAEELLRQEAVKMESRVQKRVQDRVADILYALTGKAGIRLAIKESGQKEMKIWVDERLQDVENLSRGMAEQVYFALRMAADTLLYEEENPILLDDAFAYYDEERLGRTLSWLAKSGRQVLLLTCQNREEELLEKLGIPFYKQEL